MNIKLKLIAASITTAIAVLGITQIAGAQKTMVAAPITVTAQTNSVDTPEAGDTPDVAGVTEPEEAGETPDAVGNTETADGVETGETADGAEPAGTDTDQAQQGDPETPDAPGAATN